MPKVLDEVAEPMPGLREADELSHAAGSLRPLPRTTTSPLTLIPALHDW